MVFVKENNTPDGKRRPSQRCRLAAGGWTVAFGLLLLCPPGAGCAAAAAETSPAGTNLHVRGPQGPSRGATFATLAFVPEMEPLPGMDVSEHAHRWTDADKARWADDIRRATALWEKQIPGLKGQLTAERVRSLSRWAKPQMEGYKRTPNLDGVALRPAGTDAQQGKLVLEGTLETLPTHSPLVTRWLKVYLLYDLSTKSLTRITITIRGERLE